jgi:signal transduction histidine kinase
MHDVLAHRISIVSLHAGALEVHPDDPTEDIATAAGVIRASAHAALAELREVINLLRNHADRGDDPERTAMQPPQPTLDDVTQLIEESRQAGMRVGLHLRLDYRDAVPDTTGCTVHRVVQEGLTNARKHAPTCTVEVQIADDRAGALTVRS